MRRILWAPALAILVGSQVPAGAAERDSGILDRGKEVVQAGFHKCFDKCCDKKCGSGTSCCNPCGEDDTRIGRLICQLDSPKACDRLKAICKLDDYNWQNHPEIVVSLTHAMQSDCDTCVRKKAALALKGMKACDPDTIGAMRFSAEADHSWWVRCKARCGVKRLEHAQPPVLEYVASCEPCKSSDEKLKAVPAPKPDREPKAPMDTGGQTEQTQTSRRPVSSLLSSAVAKVKSRM